MRRKLKICSTCLEIKPVENFVKIHDSCITCRSQYLRQKILCECGIEVSLRNMSRHKKSKFHLSYTN